MDKKLLENLIYEYRGIKDRGYSILSVDKVLSDLNKILNYDEGDHRKSLDSFAKNAFSKNKIKLR
jgi:hypothetical protein